jgi:hypothetical protein
MGFQSGFSNIVGDRNVFIGQSAGFSSVSGINNTFVGQSAGTGNDTGSHNLALGSGSGFTQPGLTFATAVGPGTLVSANNTIQLGRITQEERVLIPGDLQVNGAITGNFTIPPGSGNYIQNTIAPQATSNFNISGTGTANIFSAGTQYNIGNSRILSSPGTLNTFVGINNGTSITSGQRNTFVGRDAGPNTTTGQRNSFFGSGAGFENISGNDNSFFGFNSGLRVTTGSANSTFGVSAGSANLTGVNNSIYGYEAGLFATTNDNSFFGKGSGRSTTSGSSNSFFGVDAGITNTTGINNSALGRGANVGAGNLSFATAIGSGSVVGTSNTITLGRSSGADTVSIPGNILVNGATGIDWRSGDAKIRVGECDGFVGVRLTILANEDVCDAGGLSLFGGNIGMFSSGGGEVSLSTSIVGVRVIDGGRVFARRAPGGNSDVCMVEVPITGGALLPVFATCSSSIRYKTNIIDYSPGGELFDRLRPVTFTWKSDGRRDLGLVAEEVAEIDPLLVTYNDKGEVEGVKYDRIGVVLINVVKEQQRQIEELKSIVCELKPDANACLRP